VIRSYQASKLTINPDSFVSFHTKDIDTDDMIPRQPSFASPRHAMGLASFYFFLVTLLSATTHVTGYLRDASAIPFPRVYTATVMTRATIGGTASTFAAEVDLLSHVKVSDALTKISFLVHDQESLIRLRALALQPETTIIGRIRIDLNTTAELRMQIEYVGKRTRATSTYSTIANYPCYKNLQGSFDWINAMVGRASSIPGLSITKSDIGNSYLKSKNAATGYDIWALKITGNATVAANKGIFFIMSGIHAREYAPPELTSRWVESLINGYGNDADITAILDYTEIHLVLQSNPDGRQVAEADRNVMRRKNVNPGTAGRCSVATQGVDLNRNFPFRWGLNTGSSSNECSETFRGKAAGSEPEVQAIMQYVNSIFPVAQRKANPTTQQSVAYAENTTKGVFLDVHSYGDIIVSPW
jgi:carboxypeptidase T